MMSCREIRPRIALYVDREVAGADALDFEAHLTECAGCRRYYDDLRATVDAVRAASPLYEVSERPLTPVQAMVGAWNRRQKQRRWVPAGGCGGGVTGGGRGVVFSRALGI